MPYAFNLMLDPDAALAVERAYASLGKHGIADHDLVTQYGACVTVLVAADLVHPVAVTTALGRQLPAIGALAASLTEPFVSLGTPPTLCLRVQPSAPLLALHHAIYSEFPSAEVHLHYRPAYWQPHVKLANIRLDQAGAAALVAKVAAEWQPTQGMLDRLEVVRYPPTQSIWQAPLQVARHSPGAA